MNTAIHSPEFLLLLSCCRLVPGSAELAIRDKAFETGIDSIAFLLLVERHRIAPIVYLNLNDDGRIDHSIKSALFEQFNRNRLFAMRLKMWQIRLAQLLDHKGVNFVFLKGISIAERYYNNLAGRHALDIDVLVSRDALPVVTDALLQLGFLPNPDIRQFNSSQLAYFEAINHDLAFHQTDGCFQVTIELHWRFRSVMKGFNLTAVRPLNQEEEFLYLCTHGTEHAWFRLKWLFDLVQILAVHEYDWESIRLRAMKLDCLEHLEIAWLTLNNIIGLPIPHQIEKGIAGKHYREQLNHIRFCLGATDTVNETDRMRGKQLKFLLAFRKRRGGLLLAMRYLTSPDDWKLLPLPNSLFFLYFPLRPVLFLWRKLSHNFV